MRRLMQKNSMRRLMHKYSMSRRSAQEDLQMQMQLEILLGNVC